MHAWLIASTISNVISPSLLLRSRANSHRHKLSPDTPNAWQDAHTPFHDIVARPRPRSLLSLKLVDLDSIAFQIEYPIGKSAAWIFLYSDKLCRIYIFPWFAIFVGPRHCCLQLYFIIVICSKVHAMRNLLRIIIGVVGKYLSGCKDPN